ncbi:hypothetical protein [Kocuria marina]|uniref:hypothetical protein n=1 Tax=Kocuria marina TaxID=223184 RepID=UPI00119F9C9E|nr:hypothetical protein [Kocuria indica]
MSGYQVEASGHDVVEALCNVLSEKTGLSPGELLSASHLTGCDEINSIILADALDEVEDITGRQIDGSRMTAASLKTIQGMAGLYL